MNNALLEELAALHSIGMLDEAGRRILLQTVENDAKCEKVLRDFTETATSLAHDVPVVSPPPGLRREILQQIPSSASGSRVNRFTPWMPYIIAACLMAIGIYQIRLILALDQQFSSVRSEVVTLKQSNALMGLRLVTLDAKDAAYSSARIIVAWDPHLHRGVISLQKLSAPPAGHDYQLWVLDPNAETPLNAGVIAADVATRSFTAGSVSVDGPGFAVSLEPSGDQPTPTGPILFAVAPEE